MPCPRCGYPCQAGTAYCPSCQLQLVPGAPRPAGTDQMPAWVRDVQAGHGPGGGPPSAGGGFSARSLMSEDALPQWLREAGAGAGAGGPQAQRPPQGYPPPYGAAAAPPAYGQPAGGAGGGQNLYDESNLPAWLFQPGANGAPPQQYDAFPTARQPSPNGGMPQAPYNGAAPQPGPGPAPAPAARQNAFPGIEQAGAYRPAPSGGLSGSSLLDDNALPGWMRGDPSPAQGDPAAAYRDAGGLRGHSLIDDAALPAWLRNQPGPGVAQPIPFPQPQQQPQPPTAPSIANWIGGSAANDAMPAWLDQAYNDARIPPLQSPAQAPAGGAWPPPGASPNGMSPNGAPPLPGTLNASSLMDESALPEWLRAQGQGQGPSPAPPSAGRPPAGAPHGGTLADMHTARMPQPRQNHDLGQGQGWQAPRNPAHGAFGNEPEPQRFSASDLIDPDALPSFMQGGNGGSVAGGAPPFGAPAGLPVGNNASRGRAPEQEQWSDRDADQGPMRASPSRRGMPIPQDELPPWLAEPDPAPIPMQRGAPSSRRGGGAGAYDSRRVPVPRDWDDDQYDASQWTGEYEDQDADLPDEYEDDPRARGGPDGGRGRRAVRDGDRDDDRDWERGGPTGGRRRDRRGFFGR